MKEEFDEQVDQDIFDADVESDEDISLEEDDCIEEDEIVNVAEGIENINWWNGSRGQTSYW